MRDNMGTYFIDEGDGFFISDELRNVSLRILKENKPIIDVIKELEDKRNEQQESQEHPPGCKA